MIERQWSHNVGQQLLFVSVSLAGESQTMGKNFSSKGSSEKVSRGWLKSARRLSVQISCLLFVGKLKDRLPGHK